MISLIKYALADFWTFIGFLIILYLVLYFPTNLILQIIHKLIRQRTIAKHGYPPPHCDADGDFKKGDDD